MKYIHFFLSFNFQDELKIDDDDFDDLQSLFMLFDLDKDGILNFKEYEKLLRCLGYRLNGMYYCRGITYDIFYITWGPRLSGPQLP